MCQHINRPVLREALEQVETRLANACAKAGRSRDEVTLIAVTKKFPAAVVCEAYQFGLRNFGENYVQEFEDKQPGLGGLDGARFHLIGHLQSNKTRKAADLFQVIQTVDTPKLAKRLAEAAAGQSLQVMIEVKLSPEGSKSGAAPEALPELIDAIAALGDLRLTGLMTMPPWSAEPEPSRPYFARLRELAARYRLPDLSMGMSHDFETAVAEGATFIRVGTALFGPRPKA